MPPRRPLVLRPPNLPRMKVNLMSFRGLAFDCFYLKLTAMPFRGVKVSARLRTVGGLSVRSAWLFYRIEK